MPNEELVFVCGSLPKLGGGEAIALLILSLVSIKLVIVGVPVPLASVPSFGGEPGVVGEPATIEAGAEAIPVIVAAEDERVESMVGTGDGRVGLDGLD